MMKGKTRRPLTLLFLLACCILLATAGCGDLNDNPPPTAEGNAWIDIEELQAEMTANPGVQAENTNRSVTIGDSDVSTAAQTLLVGAFLATTSNTIPADYEITQSLSGFLGSSLTDSSEFLQLINLPTSSRYIEFKVPPQAAGNWQVGVYALSSQPDTLNDISDTEHKFSAVYAGTNENFFSAEDLGTTPIPVKIKRVCLMSSNPPNGCGVFGKTLESDPVVTASVEIVGVRVNQEDYTPSSVDFPIFIRTASDVTSAITSLTTIRDEAIDNWGEDNITSLTVRLTHTENTTESTNCRALSDVTNENEYTNTQLRTHCEVTDHTVYY